MKWDAITKAGADDNVAAVNINANIPQPTGVKWVLGGFEWVCVS